jgi:hypothetical protein
MMSKGFWIAIAALIIGIGVFWGIGTLYKPNIPAELASTAVVEPVVKEPIPAMIPTIHTDPKMALYYANQRMADLKADYTRNEALYQNKEIQGLREIRSELIDAMNANEYEYPSEMRYFMGCDQAYQSLVSLNYYYISESDFKDGHDLETIAEHETNYNYWLGLCEDNIQSSAEP